MRGVVKWGRNRSPPRRLLMKSAILWRISRRFSWAVTTSYRAAETGDTGAGGGGRLSARANPPGRLAPAGREAGHAGASPVTLPVCDVSDSGVFLSYVMELFLMLLLLLLLFLYLLL
uniref:YcjB n=1 Tax=Escherichia coli TaxID=562 RepID=B8XWL1_ECOLX|nr:YcjB [Escherichia coli]